MILEFEIGQKILILREPNPGDFASLLEAEYFHRRCGNCYPIEAEVVMVNSDMVSLRVRMINPNSGHYEPTSHLVHKSSITDSRDVFDPLTL